MLINVCAVVHITFYLIFLNLKSIIIFIPPNLRGILNKIVVAML